MQSRGLERGAANRLWTETGWQHFVGSMAKRPIEQFDRTALELGENHPGEDR